MFDYAIDDAVYAPPRGRGAALWQAIRCAGAAAVLILALIFSAAPLRAEDGSPSWMVSEVSGSAMARGRADAPWIAPRLNDVFGPGAEFETGSDGMLVLTHRGTTMTVSPGSRVALPTAEAAASGIYRIMQTMGTVLYRVKERVSAMSRFEVDTPILAAVVKGTTFNVNASDAGGYVHVVEGIVGVSSMLDKSEVTVIGGQTARTGSKPGSTLKVVEEDGSESIANPKGHGADQSRDDSESDRKNSQTTVVLADAGNEASVEKRHPGAVPIFVSGSGDGIFAKGITIDSAFGNNSAKGGGNGDSHRNNDDVALTAVVNESGGNGNGGNGNKSTGTPGGNGAGNANGLTNGGATAGGLSGAAGNGIGGGATSGAGTVTASAESAGNNGNSLGGGNGNGIGVGNAGGIGGGGSSVVGGGSGGGTGASNSSVLGGGSGGLGGGVSNGLGAGANAGGNALSGGSASALAGGTGNGLGGGVSLASAGAGGNALGGSPGIGGGASNGLGGAGNTGGNGGGNASVGGNGNGKGR